MDFDLSTAVEYKDDEAPIIPTNSFDITTAQDIPEPPKPNTEPGFLAKTFRNILKITPIEQMMTMHYLTQKIDDGTIPNAPARQPNESVSDYETRMQPTVDKIHEVIGQREKDIANEGIGRVLAIPMYAGMGAAAIAAPLETAATVGLFTLKDHLFNARRFVENKFPNASGNVKDMAEIADLVVSGGIIGKSVFDTKKIFETRNSAKAQLNNLNLPVNAAITPENISAIKNTDVLTPEEKATTFDKLQITDNHAQASLASNVPVKVPLDNLIDLAQEPHWDKVKQIISEGGDTNEQVNQEGQKGKGQEILNTLGDTTADRPQQNIVRDQVSPAALDVFKNNLNDLNNGISNQAHISDLPENIAIDRKIPRSVFIDQKMIDKLKNKHNLPVDEKFVENLNNPDFLVFPKEDPDKINFVKKQDNGEFLVVGTKRYNGHFVITGFEPGRADYIDSIKKRGEVIDIAGRPLGSSIETPVKGASQQELSGVSNTTKSPDKNILQDGSNVKVSAESSGETKLRGLSKGVESKAIEKKLTDGFGDLPEYKTVNMKDQASKAAELITKDYEQAKRIAMGEETAPEGVIPESLFVAVENKAIKEGDVNTLRELATASRLSTEATTMGQRIRTLAERDPESPVGAIKDVQAVREEAVLKKAKSKDVKQAREKIAKEIKKEIVKNAPKKETWLSFVQELQC